MTFQPSLLETHQTDSINDTNTNQSESIKGNFGKTVQLVKQAKNIAPKFYNFLIEENSNFTDFEKMELTFQNQNVHFYNKVNTNEFTIEEKKTRLINIDNICREVN